ncbi:MAG: hypothetical protein ACI4L8_08260, partial [Candidatus Fimadaptatus sp.]
MIDRKAGTGSEPVSDYCAAFIDYKALANSNPKAERRTDRLKLMAAAAAISGARTPTRIRKLTAERRATPSPFATTAERCVRTQRSAASNPIAERRRFK